MDDKITKIYLAGPDVFRKDAKEHFEILKEIALKYNIIALSPFDNEEDSSGAEGIFHANIKIIQKVHAVVANMVPFRGAGIDDGTAFEIGYAYARGLKIYGYSPFAFETYPEIIALLKIAVEPEFPIIESFELCCNLMMAEAILQNDGKILKTFEDCIVDLTNSIKK